MLEGVLILLAKARIVIRAERRLRGSLPKVV